MEPFRRLTESIEAEGAAALVTLVETKGSSPREAGARMVVRPSGGFHGSIGGGELERQALEAAGAALGAGRGAGEPAHRRARARAWPMLRRARRLAQSRLSTRATPPRWRSCAPPSAKARSSRWRGSATTAASSAGSARLVAGVDAAGGRVARSLRRRTTPVYLFGAGHVGRALALALAPLPFAVRWIDPRPEEFPKLVARQCRDGRRRRSARRTRGARRTARWSR